MDLRHLPLLAALSLAPIGAAADNADIRALREELARLRDAYEKRIDALEQRLAQAEAKADVAEARVDRSAAPAAAAAAATNAFNPDVSLVLSGTYGNLSKDPTGYRITGFHLPGEVRDEIAPQRGFGLGESELGISANIDPMFYGAMHFAIAPDNTVSTEEAYIQTTALPHGFTLKGGRWFSGLGYMNEQHAHTWDFVDAPLAYQAFLGGQFGNDGMQLRWVAPTQTFVELGLEAGRGSRYPGSERNKNGVGAGAVFAHVGDDVGASHSWRAGFSYLATRAQDRQWDDVDVAGATVANRFTGRSRLWVLDGVWKWVPNGDATQRNFKLQGEYLRRKESGDLVYDANAAAVADAYAARQSGWYLQGVYQWVPAWRVGLRTERLENRGVDYGANDAVLLRPDYRPVRHALMFDYSPSEFSRVRLQVTRDKSRQGVTDNQIFLQYQMSMGAHAGHRF